MPIKTQKANITNNVINFNKLPAEAKEELQHFYDFLVYKYRGKRKKIQRVSLGRTVEKLSWKMGERLFTSRDELYER
ncbi:MAG: DUF2281 domain-containing protein [Nitrospirae bacterium]|nr:DUF2281 domain-containing protein [Nitrospirota bacterium]MCL5977569.1 DUF2281 domain-containing protein [Nitrospirota bacterium]